MATHGITPANDLEMAAQVIAATMETFSGGGLAVHESTTM
jgi:hypothetical protein